MALDDSSDVRLRARRAAHIRWAFTEDPKAATAAARAALQHKFEHAVDPSGALPPAERRRRAASLKTAHYLEMARRSAKVRRERAAAR